MNSSDKQIAPFASLRKEFSMKTLRRDFFKLAAGAAVMPAIGSMVDAAPAAPKSWDSRLMGRGEYVDVDGIRTRYFHAGHDVSRVAAAAIAPKPPAAAAPCPGGPP